MVDLAEGIDRSLDVLAEMVFLTFAAVHTSTVSVTHAILDLCAYPEYLQPLSQEIHGVTKSAWLDNRSNQRT